MSLFLPASLYSRQPYCLKKINRFFLATTRYFLLLMLLLVMSAIQQTAWAQSGSYGTIYNIIQNKCASCHGGASPAGQLNLSGTSAEVYSAIVEATPNNAAAAAKGYKYIDKGAPYRSFILRKANNGLLDAIDGALGAGEGQPMSANAGYTHLTNPEFELIRQWVYAGAPQTGNVVNMNLINEYYSAGGLTPIERPAAPAAGQGFQVHFGPLFLAASEEAEYALKYDLDLPAATEVKRLDLKMNTQSHHFILYEITGSGINSTPEGLRDITFSNIPILNEKTLSVWQYSDDYRMPAGTAMFWNQNTVVDLNLHIPNYSSSAIMPADVYLNVYTQPTGTALRELKTDLLFYQGTGPIPYFFTIPANAQNYVLQESVHNGSQWNIWTLAPHTHRLGVDFDVFVNNNGSPGEHLFEGTVDGYYDWSHPPVKYFEPFYELSANTGLYHRAAYTNPNNSSVSFGLTTDKEMMITIMQYTEGDPIPFVGVPHLADNYCVNAAPITFVPAGGTLSGNGTQDGQFVPSLAGEGVHSISYSYMFGTQAIVAEYDIHVVPALATPQIAYDNDLLQTDGNYETYQWYLNGQAIDGATFSYYEPQVSGQYSVSVGANNCTADSEVFGVVVSGIAPLAEKLGFIASPNPFNDSFELRYNLPQSAQQIEIEVYNAIGQRLLYKNLGVQQAGLYTQSLAADAAQWPQGIYLLRFKADGEVITKKIAKR